MVPKKRFLIIQIGLLIFLIGAFIAFTRLANIEPHSTLIGVSTSQVASGASTDTATSSTEVVVTTTTDAIAGETKSPQKSTKKAMKPESATSTEVRRVEKPYTTPPLPFTTINDHARAALVNILCVPRTGGSLHPISASGVIIDPRGVVLTNAHVAQYVLLSEAAQVDLRCELRVGSPAKARYAPRVMYLPKAWVEAHAKDILASHPLGTGEHDYALIHIASSLDGTPLPSSFPYLQPDARETIGFVGDDVLVASYPAEFLGGYATYDNLYSATSVTSIKQLLTITGPTVDLISVGGVIGAQSGSSGGGVVNAWDRLIGIITTTSLGATTAERDLRAITLSYISADLLAQSGFDLDLTLRGDPSAQTFDFTKDQAPYLIGVLLKQIIH
ncbi:trypsin-like peptidase domain-containing protein [Candidatus Kaiserbacteria bacterium]|nr:trypsin-like peptidase domain-containing protein [Candidatus Kaiserbacteria bacterium]